ncbi:histidine kinase [Sphingomonas sp. Leaf339]|uniref:sensor histidine kinase n=1 Tax=Sphingomonas sp. Leaf339 TaxID=1736343 RepID=UPI00070125BB|nr:HAMP domain-containing sensor histidine kinase [Sphingomonas sp. Leaf339]KQU55676.1 histidine kinase [Sphingomonas sp. Leaf339]
MRLPRSTTLRFAGLVFALQLAGAGATLFTVREITRGQITAEAERNATRMRNTLLAAYRDGGVTRLGSMIALRLRQHRVAQSVVLLVDGRGRFLAGNVGDWPPILKPGGAATTIEIFRIGRDDPERMRVVATALPHGGKLLTGHVVESELRFARAMEEAMAVAMAVALALAGFAGWIAARMIEARLGRTVEVATAVADGDLHRRVAPGGGDDAFEALGAAVNAMLDRIAALVGELKMATDGLAHDLRSPLTRLRVTLERALAAAENEPGRVAVLRAMDEGDRLLTMLDTALRITRAEAGLGREAFTDTDMATLARNVADMFEPLAEDRGMIVTATTPPALIVSAHRELLSQALSNLVDNALKYGAGEVSISVEDGVEAVAIIVADDGPGIPADRREDALRRFGRLDAARAESGAGLGLSLVAAVAHLHGGTLTLGDHAPGLAARLTIAR